MFRLRIKEKEFCLLLKVWNRGVIAVFSSFVEWKWGGKSDLVNKFDANWCPLKKNCLTVFWFPGFLRFCAGFPGSCAQRFQGLVRPDVGPVSCPTGWTGRSGFYNLDINKLRDWKVFNIKLGTLTMPKQFFFHYTRFLLCSSF
jgi:hypothetical protein